MYFPVYFGLILIFLCNLNSVSGRNRSRSFGLTNAPIFQNQTSRDELSYPYLNVYYNFDSKDWNRIREYHKRLLEMRKRLSRLRHNLTLDMDRIERFLNIQKNLAINARGKLFQRALSKNVLPSEPDKNKFEPIRLYDQITNDLPQENTYFYQPQ